MQLDFAFQTSCTVHAAPSDAGRAAYICIAACLDMATRASVTIIPVTVEKQAVRAREDIIHMVRGACTPQLLLIDLHPGRVENKVSCQETCHPGNLAGNTRAAALANFSAAMQ